MKRILNQKTGRLQKGIALLLGLSMLAGAVSCKSWSRTEKGAVIGAGTGATVGGIIGKHNGNTAVGVLLGSALGGVAGAVIGHYMDKQAAQLKKDLPNATVERVGEGIKVTFNSGILFAYDSDQLSAQSQRNLSEMATTLNKYGDTKIMIDGYTDNSGTEAYNQKLSDRRAESVARYLRKGSVSRSRMDTQGFGEAKPVADNSTTQGREQNRRVEVAIMADDNLKKSAQKGDLSKL